jgi:long-chain acyl-CoA synthetase
VDDAQEREGLYDALLAAATQVGQAIAAEPRPSAAPSAARIWDAAAELVAHAPPSLPPQPDDRPAAAGPAFRALAKLGADWPELRTGRLTGEAAYARAGALWEDLMCQPPMGTYASLAAQFLQRRLAPGQLVVELGAGVGNASRLLQLPRAVTYFRTDRNPLLLRRRDLNGTPRRYDFDTAPPFRQVDIVFAVNALHCAREPRQTLAYVLEMLREGGLLLLAEGNPRTDASGRPWALDIVFCQFSGWWDRGGFRTRASWLADLRASGFQALGGQRLLAGPHDLGGLVWGQR